MKVVRWRKSSFSGGGTQTACIELASSLEMIRDSKNPQGPVLGGDMAALVRAVREGQLHQ